MSEVTKQHDVHIHQTMKDRLYNWKQLPLKKKAELYLMGLTLLFLGTIASVIILVCIAFMVFVFRTSMLIGWITLIGLFVLISGGIAGFIVAVGE